jgi:hypothetical protein
MLFLPKSFVSTQKIVQNQEMEEPWYFALFLKQPRKLYHPTAFHSKMTRDDGKQLETRWDKSGNR